LITRKRILTITATLLVAGVATTIGITIANQPKNVATFVQNGTTQHVQLSALQTQVNIQKLWNPNIKVTPSYEKQILNQYIVYDQLLLAKAEKAGIKPNSSAINNLLSSFETGATNTYYNKSASQFQSAMESLNLTNADLVQFATDQYLLHQYAQKSTPTSNRMSQIEYYQDNMPQFTTVSFQDIIVGTMGQVKQIEGLLKHHHSFASLAKKYSTDENTKLSGGWNREVLVSQFLQPVQNVLLTAPLHKTLSPIQTPFGLELINISQRNKEPFTKERNLIAAILQQQTVNQKMSVTVANIQKQAKIATNLNG
jgi:foldase protein PrsA